MKYIYTVILIILNFILQNSFLVQFSDNIAMPNTALIFVVLVALLRNEFYGSIVGLLIGLLQDIIFSNVIGVNSLIYFILGFTIPILKETLFIENKFKEILILFISTFVYYFFFGAIHMFLYESFNSYKIFNSIFSMEIVFNCIIGTIIYKIIIFRRERYKIDQLNKLI